MNDEQTLCAALRLTARASIGFACLLAAAATGPGWMARATVEEASRVELGHGVTTELVKLPPDEFFTGSTAEEKAWATGIEGGATPGTSREAPEGATASD
ncbi:MAG: hypothetical protein ACKV19_05630 [Verrucomicrobiales bacterium]